MDGTPKPVIAMCQGQTLILLVDGRQTSIAVGSMAYAAELAAAINTVTGETMAPEELS